MWLLLWCWKSCRFDYRDKRKEEYCDRLCRSKKRKRGGAQLIVPKYITSRAINKRKGGQSIENDVNEYIYIYLCANN